MELTIENNPEEQSTTKIIHDLLDEIKRNPVKARELNAFDALKKLKISDKDESEIDAKKAAIRVVRALRDVKNKKV